MQAARFLGIRDSRARTFLTTLALAFLIHLPFTPLPFILRWFAVYLNRSDTSWDYQDESVIIPISLEEDRGAPAAPAPEPAAAVPEQEQPTAAQRAARSLRDAGPPDVESSELRDAGLPRPSHRDGASEGGEAGARDATRLAANDAGSRGADGGGRDRVGDGGSGEGGDAAAGSGGPAVKDTMSLLSRARGVVSGKPNVALAFWFSTMRGHSLGPLVAEILACNPQWRDFLGNDVNVLEDFDAVVLVGPRMSETSKLTVLAQSRMDDAKLSLIFGHLAKKSGQPLIEGPGGMRAVHFRADRADRVALTHPRNMVIITPPEGYEQIRDLKSPMSLPEGRGQALSLTMVNPWRPLRGLRLRLPETLTEIRVNVFATADGGVDLQIEFDDKDAALAEEHAPEITEAIHQMSPFTRGLEFVAEGNHLAAEMHLISLFGRAALLYAKSLACPEGVDGG